MRQLPEPQAPTWGLLGQARGEDAQEGSGGGRRYQFHTGEQAIGAGDERAHEPAVPLEAQCGGDGPAQRSGDEDRQRNRLRPQAE